MQIIHNTTQVATYGNVTPEQNFSVKVSPALYQMLSSGLYRNGNTATYRELLCNAVDAMKEKGNLTKGCIKVKVPTTFDPEFYIRDFGHGLSKEQMFTLYTSFGNSTKSDTNDSIGGFGLGSKSPFSIVDSFFVTSYQKGTKLVFLMDKNGGLPTVTLMSEGATTEEDGLKVSFNVTHLTEFIQEGILALNSLYLNYAYTDVDLSEVERYRGLIEAFPQLDTMEDYEVIAIRGSNSFFSLGGVLYNGIEYPSNDFATLMKLPVGAINVTPSRDTYKDEAKTEKVREILKSKATLLGDKLRDEAKEALATIGANLDNVRTYISRKYWRAFDSHNYTQYLWFGLPNEELAKHTYWLKKVIGKGFYTYFGNEDVPEGSVKSWGITKWDKPIIELLDNPVFQTLDRGRTKFIPSLQALWDNPDDYPWLNQDILQGIKERKAKALAPKPKRARVASTDGKPKLPKGHYYVKGLTDAEGNPVVTTTPRSFSASYLEESHKVNPLVINVVLHKVSPLTYKEVFDYFMKEYPFVDEALRMLGTSLEKELRVYKADINLAYLSGVSYVCITGNVAGAFNEKWYKHFVYDNFMGPMLKEIDVNALVYAYVKYTYGLQYAVALGDTKAIEGIDSFKFTNLPPAEFRKDNFWEIFLENYGAKYRVNLEGPFKVVSKAFYNQYTWLWYYASLMKREMPETYQALVKEVCGKIKALMPTEEEIIRAVTTTTEKTND